MKNLLVQWIIVTLSFICGSIIASFIIDLPINILISNTIVLSVGYGVALYNKDYINRK